MLANVINVASEGSAIRYKIRAKIFSQYALATKDLQMSIEQNCAWKQVPLSGKSELKNADHETVFDALGFSPLCIANQA